MVDVVANHMAWNGNSGNVDYSTLVPFNKQEDFHTTPICFIEDYDNQTEVQEVSSPKKSCRSGSLMFLVLAQR